MQNICKFALKLTTRLHSKPLLPSSVVKNRICWSDCFCIFLLMPESIVG